MTANHSILVIDNYDSFTFNLVHYLMELGAEVEVVRNDAVTAAEALQRDAAGYLISPGPCTPNEAGVSLDLVAACLVVNATSETPGLDGSSVMGFRHRTLPIHGVQFHPESIATEHGHALLANFLAMCGIDTKVRV
jgi:anthranilate/para-aminobenzoate synthase component II